MPDSPFDPAGCGGNFERDHPDVKAGGWHIKRQNRGGKARGFDEEPVTVGAYALLNRSRPSLERVAVWEANASARG